MDEIVLNFDKRYEQTIPEEEKISGVYVVFAYKKDTQVWSLLYIGQAENVSVDFMNNALKAQWYEYVEHEQSRLIIYVADLLDFRLREIAKAALVFRTQPITGGEGSKCFDFDVTRIVVEGRLQRAFGTFVQERVV